MHYKHGLRNDQWIVERVFPGLRNGYFIEAGATNGINGSGTLVLERELGWSGLCVEPIPRHFARIKEWRTCSADNRALWHTSGLTLEFTIFDDRMGHSGLTQANRNFRKPAFKQEKTTLIPVETVTLNNVLDQHQAPDVIDYFCLDIEGAELEALKGFDFTGKRCIRSFSIEGHACDEFMRSLGYRQAHNPFTDVKFETYWLHSSVVADPELFV